MLYPTPFGIMLCQLALGEAEPETVEIGVPAVLISRMFTGPIAVVIAWAASFGLYQTSN